MTLTSADRRIAARELARRVFELVLKTADLNLDDLQAAVGSVDDTMDLNGNQLTPNISVKQNFIDRLPEPFKSNTNAQEKGLAMVVWTLKETNII